MKKNLFRIATAIVLLLSFNSCGNKLDGDETLEFSSQTVEQQKQSIEQSGLDLADKMTGLQQTQGYITLTQFLNRNYSSISPAFMNSFRQLSADLMKNDINALDNFNKQLRVASSSKDDIWGTWTWNVEKQDFDKATGVVVNKAVLIFPADDLNSTVNNATITVNYSESNVLIPEVDPGEFYPKSISVILKVDDVEALNAQYTGAYASDGTPTSVLQTLVIGAYNWSASVTNTNTNVSASYNFKYNSDVLLKCEASAKGKFTATEIEDINNDSINNEEIEDFLNSANVTFQIMNVAIYGSITDMTNFMTEGRALKPDSIIHNDQYYKWTEYLYDGKTYNDKMVLIYNKYLKSYGFFAKENQKFADVEFFTNEEERPDYSEQATLVYTATTTGYNLPTTTVEYDYYDYSYNYNTGVYTYTFYAYPTKTSYYAQPRLVLSDGSKITDFEKYMNDNFKTVITKFESMLPNID
ncbi:MAG: hypothetical protein PHS59_03995 [Paludibacter sp.]|nr:hypothetical protein [Paludibacter sp.]